MKSFSMRLKDTCSNRSFQREIKQSERSSKEASFKAISRTKVTNRTRTMCWVQHHDTITEGMESTPSNVTSRGEAGRVLVRVFGDCCSSKQTERTARLQYDVKFEHSVATLTEVLQAEEELHHRRRCEHPDAATSPSDFFF